MPSLGSALGSPEGWAMPPSLSEPLPPGLIPPHLDSDPPEVFSGTPVSLKLILDQHSMSQRPHIRTQSLSWPAHVTPQSAHLG